MSGFYIKRPKNLILTTSHKHAPKQEKKVAQDLNGNTTPKSGAGNIKGDVHTFVGNYHIDCKCTYHKSYSVKLEDWDKYKKQANDMAKHPVLQHDFIDKETGKTKQKLVTIEYNLLKYYQELEEKYYKEKK